MIDVTRWTQIKVIFEHAVQLSGNQREEYLEEACALDIELRRELDSLLSSYERAGTGFLDSPAWAAAGELIPDTQVGREIGAYLVTRRVGEGGMGVVYEAIRSRPDLQTRVAIKLIRRGMDSEYILRRFHKERQFLAGLDHPNIAKLLDGGITEDGSPYFVMEFIEGQLIDEYCRSRSLNAAQCVELVHQICGAMQHAHAKRIIHRDIKPGNIMVDSQGTPKLLDFGIAKLVSAASGELTQRTVTQLRMITPDYASPEQIRGDTATERSDVYSLGAVLYELVSGQRASTLSDPSATHNLPRDLQLIIRRATHQAAERRYAGMREFAEDLHRFLSGQSVSARPDSIFYRVSRRIRQHSKLAWAGSLVLAALLAVFLSWFMRQETGLMGSSRRSVAVLDFQNITGAPGTTWFSTALTEMLNAEIAAGEKIRTIPGDSVARMRADLALQPAGSYSPSMLRRIATNLHPDYVVAGSYLATGNQSDMLIRVDIRLQDVRNGDSLLAWTDTGTAAELPAIATRAGAKLRQVLGASASAAAVSNFVNPDSSRLYAEGLDRLRRFDPLGARTRLERAVAQNPSDPMSHIALAVALAQLGYQERAGDEAKHAVDLSSGLSSRQKLEVKARYETMRREWSQAAATYRTLWVDFPDDVDYGIEMAKAQSNAGNVPAARQTIGQIRRAGSAAALDPRVDLAEALAAEIAGEPRKEAELAHTAASKARQAGATQTLAESLYYEGWARWLLGDLKSARETYMEALDLFTEAGNQRRVVDIKSGMATVLLDEGKATESAHTLEEALSIARKLGNRSLEGVVNNNLGRCWEELGQLKNAQHAYEQAAVIDLELNDRSNLAVARLNLGGVFKEQGQFVLGRSQTLEALGIARAIGKKSTIAMALSNLGEERQAVGNLPEAFGLQTEALAVARDIGRKTSIARALMGEAAILRSQGRWQEAEAKYDEASRVAESAGVPATLAEVRIDQAQLLADQGRLDSAAELSRQALDELERENNAQAQALAEAILAQIASRQKKITEAQKLAVAARQHMGTGEVLITRLQVEIAEAFTAFSVHEHTKALRILRELLAETRSEGLQETAWEIELLIAEAEPPASVKKQVEEIKHAAISRGIVRIAQLEPRLSDPSNSSIARIHAAR